MSDHRNVVRERPSTMPDLVTAEESARARRVIGDTLSTVDHEVDHLRVRLSRFGGHERVPSTTVMQVNVTVNARMVRVQAVAPTCAEAIDQAGGRLLHRLHRLDRHLAAERTGDVGFTAGEWRSPFPHNPGGVAGPAGSPRRIVRMKEFHLAVQSPDSAAFAMDLRDYPFHLFVDDSAGVDALVYRGGPTGYGLYRSTAGAAPDAGTVPLTIRRWPAAPMPLAGAVELLNAATDRRFLFFTDTRSKRGRVLYRRFDGQFGLLASAW